jgi:hypothetical protein
MLCERARRLDSNWLSFASPNKSLGQQSRSQGKHKSVIIVSEVKTQLKLFNEAKRESEMTLLTSKLSCDDRRTILRGQETGLWLPLLPLTVNGTKVSAQEIRDAPLLRYAGGPLDLLPPFCDGCNQKFSVRHALECKKGGLVISRHNEIRDDLSDLALKARPFPISSRQTQNPHLSQPGSESMRRKQAELSETPFSQQWQ